MIDENKVCFIICYNNELLLNECIKYLNRLYIPNGIELDLVTVSEAMSMTSGYNEAMGSTDAKYKVYMHQDVFIVNRYFLFDILSIFKIDNKIGLIGMVGYKDVSASGVMWQEKRYGATPLLGSGAYSNSPINDYRYSSSDGISDVKVVDGLLMVTSTDIEWDEEFDGWDFYDATQCARFCERGYRVVVPNQRIPWFLHDDGHYLSLWDYNRYRKMYLIKYGEQR